MAHPGEQLPQHCCTREFQLLAAKHARFWGPRSLCRLPGLLQCLCCRRRFRLVPSDQCMGHAGLCEPSPRSPAAPALPTITCDQRQASDRRGLGAGASMASAVSRLAKGQGQHLSTW